MSAECLAKIRWISVVSPEDYFFETCGQPGVVMAQAGCVHEHIREFPLCAEHEESLERPDQPPVGCEACFEAGHLCDMVVRLGERL